MTPLPQFYRDWLYGNKRKFAQEQAFEPLDVPLATSRVKRCAASLTHGNSPLSIERGAERGGNMGALTPVYTAVLPRGVL